MFFELPNEIVYNILQYAGELRVLKRKMTRENIFQIINYDTTCFEFIYSIVDRPIRSGPPCYYNVYWHLLDELSNSKIYSYYNIYNKCNKYNLQQTVLDKLINVFINDYNNYYLDDDYYNSLWYDAICYTDYNNDIRKKIKDEIENYRFAVFYEINDFLFQKDDDYNLDLFTFTT